VVIEGDIAEAVCAEPVIRAIALKAQHHGQMTVCHEHADLYAGHPAAVSVAYDELDLSAVKYQTVLRLSNAEDCKGFRDKVRMMARQAGIELTQDLPQLSLSGFDMLRTQRFGIGSIRQPRIAIAPGSAADASQQAAWQKIQQTLGEKLQCGFVLLADSKLDWPADKNLSGRLMARETAAVISQCDAVMTAEKAYAAMALAVNVPAILLDTNESIRWDREFEGIVPVTDLSADAMLSAMLSINVQ